MPLCFTYVISNTPKALNKLIQWQTEVNHIILKKTTAAVETKDVIQTEVNHKENQRCSSGDSSLGLEQGWARDLSGRD